MAKTKDQKRAIVAQVEAALKGAASSVFVHFTKVNVGDETRMRRSLRNDGVGYVVAKKSLIRIALTNLGFKHEELPLEGELAIAYSSLPDGDPTMPASKIHAFAKELGVDKLVILGGIFTGGLKNAIEMREIATIPPVPVLRGMFLNVINSPIAGFVVALNAIATKKSE
ncbi:MAG: rplJ [Candidatus Kaiserbacteria bacterium]|nr:rplJ [Candidatus Kaiserbacteria bacterium]